MIVGDTLGGVKPERLVALRRNGGLGKFAHQLLRLRCIDIPNEVEIGAGLVLKHSGFLVVINKHTRIGDRVTIFHDVTIGRANASLVPIDESGFDGVEIGDDVILYPGARIIGGRGTLRVGAGTVVGANAVLLESTGENEVWAGNPARKVGTRPGRLPA